MFLAYIKAFHIIAVIAWMAGLLYLPRLFVYHAMSEEGSEQSETFKVMERRLLRYITTPAMLASVDFWSHSGVFASDRLGGGRLVPREVAARGCACPAFRARLPSWTKDFAADRNTREPAFLPGSLTRSRRS